MSIVQRAKQVTAKIHEKILQEDLGHFAIRDSEGVFQELHRSRIRAERSLVENRKHVLVELSAEEYGAVKHEFLKAFKGTGQTPPIFEEKETSVKPPFMEDPDKLKGTSYPKATKDVDKAHDLKRGHTSMDSFSTEASDADKDRKVTMVRFDDPRKVGEAMAMLAAEEFGQPPYELGNDGQTLIFHTWKAGEAASEQIKKAIAALKKSPLDPKVSETNLQA